MQFNIASKTRESNITTIESNVKNLMRSYVSKIFLIVHSINHVLTNKGGKTSNIDGIRYERSKVGKIKVNFQNAADLALKINYQFLKNYKCKLVKRVYIFKWNSFNFRFLGITTVKDQIIQKIFQLVIDPAVDVFADPNSYGFRKHRSCHNAIGIIADRLAKATENFTIIKVSIAKFFNTVDRK